MGISEATFYNWKKKYGGLGVSELRRLKQLEDENTRLKRMVADLSLDKQMLQEVVQKSCEASAQARAGELLDPGLSRQHTASNRCFAVAPSHVLL